MTVSTIEGELVGVEAAKKPRAVLHNGASAEVGMTVYFTTEGAKQAVSQMFQMVDAKTVGEFVSKAAAAFGQQINTDRVDAFAAKFTEKINSLLTTAFTVTAISGENRVDLKGDSSFDRLLSNIPTSLLITKDSESTLSVLKRSYGPLPLWGWSLVGVGLIGVGIVAVRTVRRS